MKRFLLQNKFQNQNETIYKIYRINVGMIYKYIYI